MVIGASLVTASALIALAVIFKEAMKLRMHKMYQDSVKEAVEKAAVEILEKQITEDRAKDLIMRGVMNVNG